MDHIAAELGLDRREFRLAQLFTDGEELLNGQVLGDAGILREAFDAIESVAPWAELQAARRPYRGIGIGAAWWVTNPLPGTAVVKLHEDGTVAVITAATDNGSGAVSMGVTQIVAEHLGIPPSDVFVTMPDTDVAGFDAGSQGSRTTRIVGQGVPARRGRGHREAQEGRRGAARGSPEDLELAEGGVRVKGAPGNSVPLAEVAVLATYTVGPIPGTGSFVTPFPDFNPGCATGLLFPSFPTPTYHVHLAEVEVDPVTGNVTVLRYLVAQEVGRVINPDGIYGQVRRGDPGHRLRAAREPADRRGRPLPRADPRELPAAAGDRHPAGRVRPAGAPRPRRPVRRQGRRRGPRPATGRGHRQRGLRRDRQAVEPHPDHAGRGSRGDPELTCPATRSSRHDHR